jgi:hypothetical protein
MSHFMTRDHEYSDLLYGDDYRAYLVTRSQSADEYRFDGRRESARASARARL